MKRLLPIAALVGALTLVLAAPMQAEDRDVAPRSTAVFPPQNINIEFNHAAHMMSGVVTCDDCHAVKASSKATDRNIPGHSVCGGCHRVDLEPAVEAPETQTEAQLSEEEEMAAAMADFYGAPDEPETPEAPKPPECTLCHAGWTEGAVVSPMSFPPANLVFPHDEHLQYGITCDRCHDGVGDLRVATRDNLPKMAVCLECHDGGSGAPPTCETCHLTGPDGLLQTEFTSGTLEPGPSPLGITHGPGFVTSHAHLAKVRGDTCESCHTKAYCAECHDGTLKPFGIHPADFVTAHPVAARQDAISCQGCHRDQSFCANCHARSGIGLEAPTGRLDPSHEGPTFRSPTQNLAFHPVGWADDYVDANASLEDGTLAARQNHHGFHARRNIQACTACHREETCLGCHTASTFADNKLDPHPPGFTQRCRSMAKKAPRSCAKCHADDAGSRCP